jgi:hypothetical protein
VSSDRPQPSSSAPPAAPTPPGPAQAPAALLERCWNLLEGGVLAQAPPLLQEANHALTRSGQPENLRAARELALLGKSLALSWQAAVRAQHQRALQAFLSAERPAAVARGPAAGLSLLALEEEDLSGVAEQAAARLRELLQASWSDVARRLETLCGREVAEAELALRPALFLLAVEGMNLPQEVAAPLARQLPAVLAPPLARAYSAIDQLLAAAGIEARAAQRAAPVLRPSGPPTLQRNLPPTIVRDARGQLEEPLLGLEIGAAAPAARKAARIEPAIDHEIPEQQPDAWGLREYVRLQALAGVSAGVLFDAAWDRLQQAGVANVVRDAPARALIGAMIAAQKSDAVLLAGLAPGGAPVESEEFVGTREQSRRLIGLAALPVHKHVVQLAARIFARIERDRLLPEELRPLLVALRFPFLEAALADPSIFVDPGHAVRALVNALASAGVGWSATEPGAAPLRQRLRGAVQLVVGAPGTAAHAFGQALAQFQAQQAEAARELVQGPLAAPLAALQAAEERELRALAVGAYLREVLAGAPLEPALARFLAHDWARVLVEAAAAPPESVQLARCLGLVPDLVWSVLPVVGAAERKRFAELVPSILERARDGVASIGWSSNRLKDFVEHLRQWHARALAAGEQAAAPAEGFSISTVRIRLDGLRLDELAGVPQLRPFAPVEEAVHHVLAAGASGITHRRAASDASATTMEPGAAEALIERWRAGSWFELRIGRHPRRVRLEGWTATRTLWLFSTAPEPDARHADGGLLSLSHPSLVSCLRHAWMKPLEPQPLLARAFRTVLADLQRAAEAPPPGGAAGGA